MNAGVAADGGDCGAVAIAAGAHHDVPAAVAVAEEEVALVLAPAFYKD